MSYITYLACSRELPCGHFGTPPKAIYESYADYCASEDYFIPHGHKGPIPAFEIERRKERYCRAKGEVVVYERPEDIRHFLIEPLPEHFRFDENDIELKRVKSHFTLPFIYVIYDCPLDYLCKYLKPSDQVQYMSTWNNEEAPPRRNPDLFIDLQDYVDGKLSTEQIYDRMRQFEGNTFVHYTPPHTVQLLSYPERFYLPDYTFLVCPASELHVSDGAKMQKQGLL